MVRSGEFGEAAAAASRSGSASASGVEEGEEKVKLAALLPGVARWTHLALNGVPNEIIEVSYLLPIVHPVLLVNEWFVLFRVLQSYERLLATLRLY